MSSSAPNVAVSMLTRRHALATLVAISAVVSTTQALGAEPTNFVRRFGEQAVAAINAPGSAAEKRRRLEPLIIDTVDVEAIARFCLGRYWRIATPQQQEEFQRLFRQVLLNNVAGRLGEFNDVGFAVTGTSQREGGTFVNTTITRPSQQPVEVQWVVSDASGLPRVIDVVVVGTSLRLTQRNDYASFIGRNGNQVAPLLEAMRKQISN